MAPLIEQEGLHTFSPIFSSVVDTNGSSASMETDSILDEEELHDLASLPPSSPSLSPVNNNSYTSNENSYYGDEYGR